MNRLMLPLTALLGVLALLNPNLATTRADGPAMPAGNSVDALGGQVLTNASLQTMLRNMGYNPEEVAFNTGGTCHRMIVQHDNINYLVRVRITGRKVWVSTIVANVTPEFKEDAQMLVHLLEKNSAMDSSFEIWPDKTLVLTRPFDNRGVTPQSLRQELDGLMNDLQSARQVRSSPAVMPRPEPTRSSRRSAVASASACRRNRRRRPAS